MSYHVLTAGFVRQFWAPELDDGEIPSGTPQKLMVKSSNPHGFLKMFPLNPSNPHIVTGKIRPLSELFSIESLLQSILQG